MLFKSMGLDAEDKHLRLVKHVDKKLIISDLIKENNLEKYQAIQIKNRLPFRNTTHIITFVPYENKLFKLYGVYSVEGYRGAVEEDLVEGDGPLRDEHVCYNLKRVSKFDELKNRVIVKWRSTRGWYQIKDLEVYSILPANRTLSFSGYFGTILNWGELKNIIYHPEANKSPLQDGNKF